MFLSLTWDRQYKTDSICWLGRRVFISVSNTKPPEKWKELVLNRKQAVSATEETLESRGTELSPTHALKLYFTLFLHKSSNSILVSSSIVSSLLCVCVCVSVLSSVWLLETTWTVAHQAPLAMTFSRQEYCNLPFLTTGDLPDPGIRWPALCLLHW